MPVSGFDRDRRRVQHQRGRCARAARPHPLLPRSRAIQGLYHRRSAHAVLGGVQRVAEDPPPHAIFVLATTEVHKIPATVISRCQRHEFRRLPASTIAEFLAAQSAKEGLSAEREALMLISRQATGSLRDAISLLDQLASPGEKVTFERVQQIFGTAADEAVRVIVKALADQDIAQGLTVINRALDGGADPRQLARQIVEYLRGVLLSKVGDAAPPDGAVGDREETLQVARRLELAHILGAIHAFVQAASEGRPGPVPGLPLEIAFLEALHVPAPRPAPGGSAENPRPEAAARTKGTRTPPQAAPKVEKGAAAAERRSSSAAEEQTPSRHTLQPATTPESNAGPGFQAVMERWKEVLQVARQREPRIQALLNSCRPLGVEQGILVLGFRSDLLREKMEKGQNLVVVSATLQQVFQEPMGVRCVLLGEGGRDDARLTAPPALEDGGMVATALKDLGAHVVDVTPEPPESG